jgi:hypothetical protein
VEETLRVVEGVPVGLPVPLGVEVGVGVALPDCVEVVEGVRETLPVLEALAPAVSEAVGVPVTLLLRL